MADRKTIVVLGSGKVGRLVTWLLADCGDYKVVAVDKVEEAASAAIQGADGKPMDGASFAVADSGNEQAVHARRFAQMIAVVRRETFRAVEEGLDSGVFQGRHTMQRHFQNRLEMIKVIGQLIETEFLGDAIHSPRLGHRLERAEQHFASIFFQIKAVIIISQYREIFWKIIHRFCNYIKMFIGI